ncbi:hypothetical protein GGI17_005401 [Coemansia sp. S146]|nr:hypothetical protein GGI17_005401 [Coemansia sp. S146]
MSTTVRLTISVILRTAWRRILLYFGETLEMISRAPYEGCPFPLARKITFIFVEEKKIVRDEDVWNDPSKAEANIDTFVNRFKQMAPSVGEIRVQLSEYDDVSRVASQHFGDLASRLYQFASRIEDNYFLDAADLMGLRLDMVCNLSHISYATTSRVGNVDQFAQLARKNGLTLQSLVLKCEKGIDVLGLAQDAEGNHVADWTSTLIALLATTPFSGGNAASLEHLCIRLDRLSVSMLRKHKVFVPGSHPKLHVVRLSYTDDFGSELFSLLAEALLFMYSIGSGAPVREYSQAFHSVALATMLTPLSNYACIQVLSLPNLCPNFWQVIALIKSLPLLGRNCTELLTCVLLLTLACPNFDYVDAVTRNTQSQFLMEQIEKSASIPMEYLSAFQLLPPHVVKPIVDHVAGCSRLQFDGITTDSDEHKMAQMPLLWVCHNFRALLLSGVPYEGYAFPLVRKLVFDLTTYDTNDDCYNICPLVTAANITAFAQQVKQMAPAVSEIDVWSHGMVGNLLELRDAHALDLARQLFGIVKKHTVITRGSKPLVTYMDLEPIRDLLHIDYKLYAYPNDIMPLIRCSTRTLQLLDIGMDNTDATSLARDPDGGGYLEYPCLQTLNMDLFNDTVPSPKAAFIDIVPFPRLLRLGLLAPSPFSDDTLFRGNTSTLEYLKLKSDPETISILREYRVFTPTSHPNLKCVKICSPPPRISNAFATVAEYMQFFLSIAPGASVREISELVKYNEDLTPVLSMFKDHGCIQVLSLPDTSLSLWETIALVKLLPLLSDLTTRPPSLGELLQDVGITMLPSYVRATFAPMGRRFRCWHISPAWITEVNYVEVATCVLLLALVCPNFDYAIVYSKHQEPFMKAMKEKIDEPEFSKDAPRLRRLLSHGWKDC